MSSTNLSPAPQLSVGKKHMWCFQREDHGPYILSCLPISSSAWFACYRAFKLKKIMYKPQAGNS